MTKEQEILKAITHIANTEDKITFAADWGGNSLTIIRADGRHTHCGWGEATTGQLVDDLHNTLVKRKGLSWKDG